MNNYEYNKEDLLSNKDNFMNALDEMYNENINDTEVDKIRETFNKTQDPYTPLEKVSPLIDKVDKYTDIFSFSIPSIFVIFALFLLFATSNVYNETLLFTTIIFLLASITALSFIAAFSNYKSKEILENLINLRLKYFDKSIILEFHEKREKQRVISAIVLIASIFIGVLTTFITIIELQSEFLFVPLLLIFSFGFFIYSRYSKRADTTQKIVDSLLS